ncbi:MAG: hypothetical protein JWR59_2118 [Brevundimonas sp.]|nr:hypothetical protein [Brevundimonas sp.]
MKSVLTAIAAVLILPVAAAAALPAVALAASQTTAPATRPATTPAPAQTGAAATLPNTFDAPAAQTPARPAPATPTGPAAATPSDPAKVAAAEIILKKTIAAMQAGAPNYGDMTSDLAEKVRAQAGNVLPMFEQLGALQTVTHVGAQDGAELFSVIFTNAPTQWIIAQNAQGKIVALLFRPAPPPTSAPGA